MTRKQILLNIKKRWYLRKCEREKQITVNELIEILEHYKKNFPSIANFPVLVIDDSPSISIGPRKTARVTGAYQIIDWDKRKMFLSTEFPMVKKEK